MTISRKPRAEVAADLAKFFGDRIRIVEPYADALPPAFDGTAARLIDIDTAIETCPIMIVLVDHEGFRSVPLDERPITGVRYARHLA